MYNTIKIYRHANHIALEPKFQIMISLSPQNYSQVKVPFDLFNQIEFLVNMHRLKSTKEEMENIIINLESFVHKISQSSCINFLDDSSLESNARKLMFTTKDQLKEAFCGMF